MPDKYDMYRGVKRLHKLMPQVFHSKCTIHILDDDMKDLMLLVEFIKIMEKKQTSGKLLYQIIKKQRMQAMEQYSSDLKDAVSMQIESDEKIEVIWARLTISQKKSLASGL